MPLRRARRGHARANANGCEGCKRRCRGSDRRWRDPDRCWRDFDRCWRDPGRRYRALDRCWTSPDSRCRGRESRCRGRRMGHCIRRAWAADASMNMMIVVVSLDMRLFSTDEAAKHHAWPFARRSVKFPSTSYMAFLEILSSLGSLRKGMKNRKSASCSRIIFAIHRQRRKGRPGDSYRRQVAHVMLQRAAVSRRFAYDRNQPIHVVVDIPLAVEDTEPHGLSLS